MTAVDTNVLLRIVTNDDKSQAARAAAFLQKQDRVYLAKTVLLEFEWVLRRAYGFAPPEILAAFVACSPPAIWKLRMKSRYCRRLTGTARA